MPRIADTDDPESEARSQSSMDYLTTYGWVVVLVAVILVALWQIGVFNSTSQSPRAQPGSCKVVKQQVAGGVQENLLGQCTGLLPQYVGQFNGEDSYVSIPDPISLDSATSMTVAMWFKPVALGGSQGLLGKNYDTRPYVALWINSNGGTYWEVANVSSFSGTDGPIVSNNNWDQLVIVQNGTLVSFYINGAFASYSTLTISLTNSINSNSLNIGRLGTVGYYFDGLMSNVQIYNTSLSTTDIHNLYAKGIGAEPLSMPGLAGWWPLNGNANDYSGNGNNGMSHNLVMNSTWSSGYS